MAGKSSIEWTNRTWNPVRGCSMAKGSEIGGCLNCYAARMASRNLPELKSPTTGKPFARILDSGPRWTGDVELIESALDAPLHWKKPQRIFVNSMSDLFHEALPDEAIDRVFAVMALCPQHTFQVLTKRPERMLKYFGVGFARFDQVRKRAAIMPKPFGLKWGTEWTWPLPNVWLGVSVENQATADARIPLLLRTPAAKRFVSYEPALGPVDFERGGFSLIRRVKSPSGTVWLGLDWLIVGGESGPGARPFDIQWARNTIQQCCDAGVACFVKQLGAKPFGGHSLHKQIHHRSTDGNLYLKFKDRKGGDMPEWPEDLRVREFPAKVQGC